MSQLVDVDGWRRGFFHVFSNSHLRDAILGLQQMVKKITYRSQHKNPAYRTPFVWRSKPIRSRRSGFFLVPTIHGFSLDHLGLNISTFICQGSLYVPILVEYYIHMSNERNYCNTNLVLLGLGLAEGCAKPSLPIGDNPITETPVLHELPQSMSCLRNPHYR